MDFSDRLTWLLIGCLIGYVLRMLQDIRKGLAQVDEHVIHSHDESGKVNFELLQKIALAVVVILAFYASVQSQRAANTANDTSDKIISAQGDLANAQKDISALQVTMKQNVDCTTQILFDTINAINERTTYTTEQADSNIALVQAQLELLVKGSDPALTDTEGAALFNEYVKQVRKFIRLSEKTKAQQTNFPYPTVKDLTTCLAQSPEETAEPSGG